MPRSRGSIAEHDGGSSAIVRLRSACDYSRAGRDLLSQGPLRFADARRSDAGRALIEAHTRPRAGDGCQHGLFAARSDNARAHALLRLVRRGRRLVATSCRATDTAALHRHDLSGAADHGLDATAERRGRRIRCTDVASPPVLDTKFPRLWRRSRRPSRRRGYGACECAPSPHARPPQSHPREPALARRRRLVGLVTPWNVAIATWAGDFARRTTADVAVEDERDARPRRGRVDEKRHQVREADERDPRPCRLTTRWHMPTAVAPPPTGVIPYPRVKRRCRGRAPAVRRQSRLSQVQDVEGRELAGLVAARRADHRSQVLQTALPRRGTAPGGCRTRCPRRAASTRHTTRDDDRVGRVGTGPFPRVIPATAARVGSREPMRTGRLPPVLETARRCQRHGADLIESSRPALQPTRARPVRLSSP